MTAAPKIELWLVDLEGSAPALQALERDTPRLAAQDRDRALAIADPCERRHRLAAYTALRLLLERMAGAHVRGRPLLRGPGGKPRLGEEVDFSLSHTEGLALIGIARSHAIGVDLERERQVRVSPNRRAAICAAGAGLAAAPLPEGDSAAFLQAWSRLEAFAKAQGRGLARTFAELGLRGKAQPPTPLGDIEAAARRLARTGALEVSDVNLGSGLFGAIALSPSAPRPRLRRLPQDRAGLEQLLAHPAAAAGP